MLVERIEAISCPHHCPRRLAKRIEHDMVTLRRQLRVGPRRLDPLLGLPHATVSAVLRRHGVSRLRDLDRPTGLGPLCARPAGGTHRSRHEDARPGPRRRWPSPSGASRPGVLLHQLPGLPRRHGHPADPAQDHPSLFSPDEWEGGAPHPDPPGGVCLCAPLHT